MNETTTRNLSDEELIGALENSADLRVTELIKRLDHLIEQRETRRECLLKSLETLASAVSELEIHVDEHEAA